MVTPAVKREAVAHLKTHLGGIVAELGVEA